MKIFLFIWTIAVLISVHRTKAEAIKLADDLYAQLQKGADFSQLVIGYSEDPASVTNDGQYDTDKRGAFIPELEERLWNAPIHEISKPFKSTFGYHIMEVLSREGDHASFRQLLIMFKE